MYARRGLVVLDLVRIGQVTLSVIFLVGYFFLFVIGSLLGEGSPVCVCVCGSLRMNEDWNQEMEREKVPWS